MRIFTFSSYIGSPWFSTQPILQGCSDGVRNMSRFIYCNIQGNVEKEEKSVSVNDQYCEKGMTGFFFTKSINQFVQMCLFTVNCGDHSARTCAECGSSLSRCGGECILCNERCEPLNQINPSSCNSKYNLLLINIPLEAWQSMNLRISLQSNLVIRNVLIRNELALRNHFQ